MFWSRHSKQRRSEFAQLVREDGPSLVLLARRLTGNRDAEDVLQGALLGAWKSFSSRADLRNPRAWLAQFVAHEAQNLIRREHRRQDTVDVTEAEPATALEDVFSALQAALASGVHVGSPQELLDYVDGGLRSALLTLTEPERATFLMRVIVDLSYKELADVFGVPIGTVMSRLCRAREKLRTQLRSSKTGSSPSTSGEDVDAPETRGQRESTA
jgi:RNA polymerase sigma-70 factor (ECF subfamily)